MVGAEPRRRSLKRVALAEPPLGPDRRDRRPPRLGSRGQSVADALDGRRARMPDPRAEEHLTWLEVEVEARGVGLGCAGVAEVDADVRLVRRLVLGEARIAVDAEQRAPVRG